MIVNHWYFNESPYAHMKMSFLKFQLLCKFLKNGNTSISVWMAFLDAYESVPHVFKLQPFLEPPWLLRPGIDQQSWDQCACQEPLWTTEVIVEVHRAQGYFRDHIATHNRRPQSQSDSRIGETIASCYQLKLETSNETSCFSINISVHVDVMA